MVSLTNKLDKVERHGDTTREKIRHAARDEFAERGLAGARVDRIAARAGVNKAMIYYHFHSKEGLYQAIIDSHLEKISRFFAENLRAMADPKAVLTRIASFHVALIDENPQIVPILLREMAGGGERVRRALTGILIESGVRHELEGLIEAAKQSGGLRNLDTRHAMISFMGMSLFYLIMAPLLNAVWEIKDPQAFLRERPEAVMDLFLNGFLAR